MGGSSSQKLEAACLILAGGKGKRLTPDKPLLEIEGRPIIQRVAEVVGSVFEEVLVVTNTPQKYDFLGLPHAVDERPGHGPLMGIYSGLVGIEHEVAFVCAADMPFLDEEIIRAEFFELPRFDIVVPYPRGMPEFLHAFYRKRCLPAIRENLEADLFKIELLTRRCKTRRLTEEWFVRNGWAARIDRVFTNINTPGDYRRWSEETGRTAPPAPDKPIPRGSGAASSPDPLSTLVPDVLRKIRKTLTEQETAFQNRSAGEEFASLWTHSSRVGRIAHHVAKAEGWDAEPALLAGLLHDMGKFAYGRYHEDDIAEEERAIGFIEGLLANTVYETWIPEINEGILSLYREEEEEANPIGRAVYDADRLDKLGYMGVAQFFAKNALRRHFLDDEMMTRASIELTYARHAFDTLKTETGKALAREKSERTRRFYIGLLEEWKELGLGDYDILEEDVEGIDCVLVVPRACPCGGRLNIESDIRESVKCRSAVVHYICTACKAENEFSFCLPNVEGLPRRREAE